MSRIHAPVTHALRCNVWRAVTHNMARFIAVFAIVAIGAGVYAGLRMFAPDMYVSADKFYDQYNLADIQVSSPLGLTDSDLAAIRETPGVRAAMGMQTFEMSATRGSDTLEIEVSARDMSRYQSTLNAMTGLDGDQSAISHPILLQGRLPEAADEIVVCPTATTTGNDDGDGDGNSNGVRIGDVLKVKNIVGIDSINDVLLQDTFTVVGIVQSPEWLTVSLSVSPTSGASLTNYGYVDLSATVHPTTYTTVAVTCNDAYNQTAFTDEYDAAVAPVIYSLKERAAQREQARYDELVNQANLALMQARTTSLIGIAGTHPSKSDALEQIDQAKAAYDELIAQGVQHWYVVGRDASPSYYLYKATALRMDRICSIFPAFFFVVAALVSLTTVKRMVETDRVEIGTLKALGYSRRQIARKYLVFSTLAAVGGSIVGICVGIFVLPIAIWTPYSQMYIDFPFVMGFHGPDCAIAFFASVGLCLIMTLVAVHKTLREPAAALLVPATPKAGRHIAFERIRPLWRHIPFSLKVTARNIARYKGRMIMTIIGVAGCTGLVLTGFGVQDKLDGFVQAQYGGIYTYDLMVNFKAAVDATGGAVDAGQDPNPALTRVLDEEIGAGNWEYFYRQAALATNPDGDPTKIAYGIGGDLDRTGGSVQAAMREGRSDFDSKDDAEQGIVRDVGIYVPLDNDQDFIRICDYQTGEQLELPESGVIISQRLAEQLMVDVGDTIELAFDGDDGFEGDGAAGGLASDDVKTNTGAHKVQVAGIMRLYASHCVYMGPAAYKEIFGGVPAYNMVLGRNARGADIGEIRDKLLSVTDAGVQGVSVPHDESGPYEDIASSLNGIVLVILIVSGLLVFIVVYALTEINIEERQREIATLKVLGFVPREVRGYVYRETYLLAGVGILLGLPFGSWLCDYVMRAAEFDNVIYFRTMHIDCYLWAALLTTAFVCIVMLAMRRRLMGIDMISSLKSVD